MPSQTDWDAALEAVANGATLVTGNARLARRALGDEAALRRVGGQTVWRRGDILPWTAWLKRLHVDALVGGAIKTGEPSVLLSPAQAEALWQQTIETDPARPGLLQPAAAARQALDAHDLCRAWRIDRKALMTGRHHEDVAAFLRWSDVVDRTLGERGWLAPAELPDRAPEWLRRRESLRPTALCLAGFEEFTPQQQALLAVLEELGVTVCEVVIPEPARREAVRIGCADSEGEMIAAAHWARRRIAADPGARIGIVVRDLAQRRWALSRHLDAVLEPAASRQPGHRRQRPWNLSLGLPLVDEPMIHDALLVLTAATGRLGFSDASRLLRSPFLAGAESERADRLRAECRLRKLGDPQLGTAWLLRVAQGPGEPVCTEFATRLERVLDAAEEGPGRRPPMAWAEHFTELLRQMGWPGERGADSHEHQAAAAWQDLLQDFSALGTVVPELDRAGAITRLRRFASGKLFQPKSAPAPVQVLGLFEALGQRFDALWIMGLHDEVWPETPRPNPFLPIAIQRDRKLPRATATRELAFAERLTGHLLAAAPEVVASWPQRADDRGLRPSPLIADLPEHRLEPPVPEGARQVMLAAARFEAFEDGRGPAVRDGDRVHGGTGLFRDQSLCPFRAFAIHRLHAAKLDSPAAGLDPMQRGILVHHVLDKLWEQLGSRDALEALGDDERRKLVHRVVTSEVEHAARRQPAVFTPRFTEVERRRLGELMLEWLEKELERPDFRVVEREQSIRISIGFLSVLGRVDRIDELPDGGRMVIDYKTGRTDPGKWLGERPEDPQLPLYSLQYGDELAGVVMGQVRLRQCRWTGVTRDENQVSGVQGAGQWRKAGELDWKTLRGQWREMADRLATEIMEGRAEVDPIDRACDYCHLSALCRVDELRGGLARMTGVDLEEGRDD
jgi:probable DNA repair protein